MKSDINEIRILSVGIFREERQGILTYSIFTKKIRWSHTFDVMENAKKTMAIEDYSVSQNSMEQVVLTLLKAQTKTSKPKKETTIEKLITGIKNQKTTSF